MEVVQTVPGRWIIHKDGRRQTGTGAPPEGAPFHWVTETGSMHMADDTLLIDGQPAPSGAYVLDVGEEEVPIEVDSTGKAKRKAKRPKDKGPDKPDTPTGGGGTGGGKK